MSNLNEEEEKNKEKKIKNSAHHTPIHYDGEDLGHSYLQSTTMLCDKGQANQVQKACQ